MVINKNKPNPISVAKAYAACCMGTNPSKIRSNGGILAFVHKEKKYMMISIEDKIETEEFKEFTQGYYGKAIEKITDSYNNGKKMREQVLNSGYPVHDPNLK